MQRRYKLRPSKRNLLDLPAEVKARIYQYVFEDAHIQYVDKVPTGRNSCYEVLLAAKICYQEAKAMFYKSATVRIYHCWREKTTSDTFNASVLQHVEQITVRTASDFYCLPEILKEMKSLKRVMVEHTHGYQVIHPKDGLYVKDEELSDRFKEVFNPRPSSSTLRMVMTLSANKLEVSVPVMFDLLGCHGLEIYCEFNETGSMRRIKEVRLPFDKSMGCDCGTCHTKAVTWLRMRLRWIAFTKKRWRNSVMKEGEAANAIV